MGRAGTRCQHLESVYARSDDTTSWTSDSLPGVALVRPRPLRQHHHPVAGLLGLVERRVRAAHEEALEGGGPTRAGTLAEEALQEVARRNLAGWNPRDAAWLEARRVEARALAPRR